MIRELLMVWRRLLNERASAAAVEFAIISPVMIVLFLGTIELTNVIRLQEKLNVTAGQLVEMVAAQSSVTEGTARGSGGSLGDMCKGATYNMLPYNPNNIAANIDNETITSGFFGPGFTVQWVDAQSCPTTFNAGGFYGTPTLESIMKSPRSLMTQDGSPSGVLVPGYSAVAVNMSYVYVNILPFFLSPSITLTAVAAVRPRANTSITCTYLTGSPQNGTMNCPGS